MPRLTVATALALAAIGVGPALDAARAQRSDRVAVRLETAGAAGPMRVSVSNDHTFAIEAIRIAWGNDPADPDDELDLDFLHALDGRETALDERPIAPGETRAFDLDVAGLDRSTIEAWVRLALFTDQTWVGEETAAEERLGERRNEAEDLEYWIGTIRNLLDLPARQAKRILNDRLMFRRDLGRGDYTGATERLREIRELVRRGDDEFRDAAEGRVAEYTRLRQLAQRTFARRLISLVLTK